VLPGLEREAAALEKVGNRAEAAARLVVLAETYQALGQRAAALDAASRAVDSSRQDSVLLPAALVLLQLGDRAKAQAIAADLDGRLQGQSRSYALLIRGEIDRRGKRLPAAIDALREAQQRHDSWFAHLLLAYTYFDAGDLPSALSEFEACVARRGEVSDVFFADSATLRYLPPVYYWLARAQEALGNPDARANYEQYVALRAQTDAADPLLADARQRLAAAR
jgi:tetratricopeptide (TPR) repeat protein